MNDAVASTEGAERGHEDDQTSLAGWILLLAWLSVGLGLGVGIFQGRTSEERGCLALLDRARRRLKRLAQNWTRLAQPT